MKELADCIRIVQEVIAREVSQQPDDISADSALYETLGIDSSGIVTLLLELEQRCGIEFDMEELEPEHLATVQSLAVCIFELKSS
ncbi:acyl carrier protein [Marinicrinis sediminis]|uniref:Acyl carrier protein n=1 Tax=Marinicrinis sediminis TaxID=1652465 RepID=A0ABW5RFZ1_9BACL